MSSGLVRPRDRWLALFTNGVLDRLPCDYWGTPEVTRRLMRDLGCATERALWERLGVDKSVRVGAELRNPRPPGTSVWNVRSREIAYGGGIGSYMETDSHPLAHAETVSDVEAFDWPDPEWWDVSVVSDRCNAWSEYPRIGGSYEPFLLYCQLRGMERALEDLMLQPEVADAALERIFAIHYEVFRRTFEVSSGRIEFMYVAEDLGTQDSLIMSPSMFRRFLKPRMARMIELVHANGALAFHHDDGAIARLIPDLLEIGIDILNPIQWRCPGMERDFLAREFGERVVFHGAVDNQHTLPFGSPEDVRQEVRDNVRIFGGGKGYVIAPCHNIQPNTSTENILALYEAAHETSG